MGAQRSAMRAVFDAGARRGRVELSLDTNYHLLTYKCAHRNACPTPTMADFRRRMSTMQGSMDPYASRSNLPMPSTAKKPVHHSGRMSMSGPALRAPYPMAAPGPHPTPRQSMMRSQNMNPLLMSVTKANAFGRTPVHGYEDAFHTVE